MFPIDPLILFGIAFVSALLLTYAVRELATKLGFVAKPKADRWHKRPTALMGGVAIFLTTAMVTMLFVPLTPATAIVLACSSLMFIIGLIDDVLNIKPYQKLFGQVIGAAIVIGSGLQLQWTEFQLINIALTLFWLIGITNAINLLDNMDGLAAGISTVAALSLAAVLYASGNLEIFPLTLVFVGALLGFLRFNFNPLRFLWAIPARSLSGFSWRVRFFWGKPADSRGRSFRF